MQHLDLVQELVGAHREWDFSTVDNFGAALLEARRKTFVDGQTNYECEILLTFGSGVYRAILRKPRKEDRKISPDFHTRSDVRFSHMTNGRFAPEMRLLADSVPPLEVRFPVIANSPRCDSGY
jgi:hypothetical protein